MKASPNRTHSSPVDQSKIKRKILIIDDDAVVAELLRNFLGGKKGFAVLAAENGVDGIRAAIEHVPDIILLDTRLADMTGLEVHEKLRQNPLTKDIPVIYVSSFLSLRTIEQATSKGARGFISKPFTLSGMYAKMASVLNSST